MDSDIKLFISSTSDLNQEREKLAANKELLRLCKQFHYGEFGAGSDEAGNTSPEKILREQLKDTDVFIGLLGPKYGTLYHPPNGSPSISIVEWEFNEACRCGLEIMPFLKTIAPTDKLDQGQDNFRERVSDFQYGKWCEKYDSPDDLPGIVRRSLQMWLVRQYKKARARTADWLNRILAPLAVGLILLCVLVSLLFVAQILPFSQSSVFGFCALTFFAILLTIVTLKSQMGR